ncbi:Membrane-bound lytic murein transglycosylase B [Fundidesulfovibrio magnetotacticus]|uniref:Membrane-bound lytic murein transglycosylase B n=1 Tax=Fundidesulfovibrio magnetotacticus TaxID=2730080 RepID=A0A6V8LVJ3_9BACT|nr:lytic murein transglycosylase [Fundidesulfovibrio magnetotacticus]GFK94611.1 Membrane-bound lytic murein transglycosylase B [Fundidesulfovibrio magnetotacticus]
MNTPVRFRPAARILACLCLAACLLAFPAPSVRAAATLDAVKARLIADGVPRDQVEAAFARPSVRFTEGPMSQKLFDKFTAKYGSDTIRGLQQRLMELGWYSGKATGRTDFVFRLSVRAFQKSLGLKETGKASPELLVAARREKNKAPAEEQARLKVLAEKGPPDVWESIFAPERLAEAREFYNANQALLEEIHKAYGVPPAVTTGLLTLETRTGRFLGDDLALNNLASLAACTTADPVMDAFQGERVTPDRKAWLDAKAAETAAWAYKELKALFRYAQENRLDVTAMPGSYMGAIGISQFMPTSLLAYGRDGDGDGRVDIFNLRDAMHSMGNYLNAHGVKGNLDDDAAVRAALFRYNHSQTYVNTIMGLAAWLKGAPAPVSGGQAGQ